MKAAKYSKVDKVDESSSQEAPKDILPETDFSVGSEVFKDEANLQAGTSAATSCGLVLSSKNKKIMSGDEDKVTASDGEEVTTTSDDTLDQEGTCAIPEQQESYDEQIKSPDEHEGLLSVGSMKDQSLVEANVPSSDEMEAEGSPPKERQEDVNDDQKIEPAGEIDFETGSPGLFFSFTSQHTV